MKLHYYYDDILNICKNKHLTADDVFVILKKKYPSIWISTVYRNLDNLIKKWELTKITNIWKKAYFEINKWIHMHLFDKSTWNIIDIDPKDFNINLPKGFKVDNMELTVTWRFVK